MVSLCQAVKSTTSPTDLHQTEVAAVERQQRVTQLSLRATVTFGHGSWLKQTYQYHWYFLLHKRVIVQLMLDWNVFTDISRQASWIWPQKVILDLTEAIGTTPQKCRRLTWEAGATAWEWWFCQPEISWILTSMDYKIYIMFNFFEPCTQAQIQNQWKIHGTGWTKLGCFVVQIWNYENIYIYLHTYQEKHVTLFISITSPNDPFFPPFRLWIPQATNPGIDPVGSLHFSWMDRYWVTKNLPARNVEGWKFTF